MRKLVFGMQGSDALAASLCILLAADHADFSQRRFPDGETYLRINSEVQNADCIIVCTLFHPDEKVVPLYYLASLCRELGARKITLVAPYLAYMRQDKRFHPGEAITSEYFARLLSPWLDELITIDPHLHRKHNMAELYSIPCKVLHATTPIALWIKEQIHDAILIGPDSESGQWVSAVAAIAGVPFVVLDKVRHGDNEVEISLPDMDKHQGRTPVLIDDIISTGRTMIETIGHLKNVGMKPGVCIGVHAIFSGNAYRELVASGAAGIITCNTICHETNRIDVSSLIGASIH